jgi:hypothetical protein
MLLFLKIYFMYVCVCVCKCGKPEGVRLARAGVPGGRTPCPLSKPQAYSHNHLAISLALGWILYSIAYFLGIRQQIPQSALTSFFISLLRTMLPFFLYPLSRGDVQILPSQAENSIAKSLSQRACPFKSPMGGSLLSLLYLPVALVPCPEWAQAPRIFIWTVSQRGKKSFLP